MTFYLIGTGLNKKSISVDALEILKSCDKIYLEDYTINFPFDIKDLETALDLNIKKISRQEVENESIVKESKNKNIALLVYGDPLSATTHMQLILSCKNLNIKYKIFNNASIMTAVSRTGLQLYKFGKTISMPNWEEHKNKPTSFIDHIKENLSINSHTLVLTDIGLKIKDAINQLKESSQKKSIKIPEKIIALSNAGTKNQRVYYDSLENLKNKDVKTPFCLIIPSNLHFLEKEVLEKFKD
tara:strand:+ start:4660 stop:5385 length:726 start_codon:yes stop_codon:yes gene_type:complete